MTNIKLPEGVRLFVEVYVCSDTCGAEIRARVGPVGEVPQAGFRMLVESAATMLNDVMEVSDARPMTSDEIKQYIDEQDKADKEQDEVADDEED